MTDEEIVKVISVLIGKVVPIAETYYDDKVRDNITKQYSVISHLIADIGCMSLYAYDSPYYSESECGKLGIEVLENIKKEIEEYLNEVNE